MAARSFAPGFQRMNASSTKITTLVEVEQLEPCYGFTASIDSSDGDDCNSECSLP